MIRERADLAIDGLGFERGEIVSGEPIRFAFDLKNSGGLSATIEKFVVARRESLPPDPEYPAPGEQREFSILAGASMPHYTHGGAPLMLSWWEAFKMRRGDRKLYLVGYVQYRDAFALALGTMVTGFCFQYEVPPNGQGRFSVCAESGHTYTHRYWAKPQGIFTAAHTAGSGPDRPNIVPWFAQSPTPHVLPPKR